MESKSQQKRLEVQKNAISERKESPAKEVKPPQKEVGIPTLKNWFCIDSHGVGRGYVQASNSSEAMKAAKDKFKCPMRQVVESKANN